MDGPEPAIRSRPAPSRQDVTAAPGYPPPPFHVHHLPPAAAAAGAPPPENNPERWIVIDGILFAYNATVVMGIDLKALFDGWGTAAKVAYGVAMAAAASSLGLGLMAASCAYMMRSSSSSHSQGLYRRISASCARFGAILSTVLSVICISSSVGSLGWIGGIFFSAVVAGGMAGIWIWGQQAAAEAVPLP